MGSDKETMGHTEKAPQRGFVAVFSAGEKQNLRGSVFCRMTFERVDFSGADLRGACFDDSSLSGSDFSFADLRGVEFLRCDLRRARFTSARLGRNRFEGSWLTGAVGLDRLERAYIVRLGGRFLEGVTDGGAGAPDVHAAISRGGVYSRIAGATRNEVLRSVAHLPGIPDEVDRGLLHHLLLTREALRSTGIGDGIAIPHPRSPLVLHLTEPIIFLCFLEHEVDFGALDGQPVRALFTLLSPSIQTHLALLAKLAHFLHDEPLRRLLRAPASREEILERVRTLEEATRHQASSVARGASEAQKTPLSEDEP
jgi:PTS system nitrogen regulatory IIA component